MSMPSTTTGERGNRRLFAFLLGELKPKGKLLTPFNLLSAPIILAGLVILYFRFTRGLGATTNLSQEYPWGIWIGFDVVTGVAFAGGAYVITFLAYVMRLEKYHAIARITVLNGFLAYLFYAGALVFDLGRPWHIVNPVIGNEFGFNSVMFLVAWHFLLYMVAEFIEFSPAIAEWLGWKRVRKVMHALTLGAVIFGITLSTLHQAGLGALFLMAKTKIHPLWYSEYIPVLFFVSSVFAGLSMIILEGTISGWVFKKLLPETHAGEHRKIVLSLAKGAAMTMFTYFFAKLVIFIHGKHLVYLATGWGLWYLVEMIGFTLVPCVLYVLAVKRESTRIALAASIMALLGIAMNRLNISIIAFNYESATRYVPSWMEIVVTLMVVFAEIWVFRWVVNRMPVLKASPAWAEHREG
jgi:Ni/Fe-hydrogenase subunit HybB-like protein